MPVSPNVAVSKDILQECKLELNSVERAPKFEFDKSELLPADVEVLSKIAECFVSGPMKGTNMALVGRADPRGTSKYNDALGMRRAASVEDYLVKAGMDASTIERSSRGKRDAVGTDEATWAVDRRVDVLTR
jgi:peptidoglycan-associated lipoprotein